MARPRYPALDAFVMAQSNFTVFGRLLGSLEWVAVLST
jgi:hypothetical protein